MKDQKSASKKTVKLTTEDVRHVAYLARLQLSADQIEKFLTQLSSILHLVEQVSRVDTTNIEPTSQVTGLENVFRNDEVNTSLSQEEVIKNSSRTYKGYFMVDAIFEE